MLIDPLPDVSKIQNSLDWGPALPWVGMSQVDLPINFQGLKIPAQADFYVNLVSSQARGIHMSRLYSLLSEKFSSQEFSFKLLEQVAVEGLESHQGLSTQTQLQVSVNLPLQRSSLKSELQGWRIYPVQVRLERSEQGTKAWLQITILYSSTCPASAALAYQIQSEQKNPSGFAATPHAQRSQAQVSIQVAPSFDLDLKKIVDLLEGALGTPVQTLVKRQDEQQFAILNAQNLMFCEDAARRLAATLEKAAWALDFKGQVQHLESLHAHNATAFFSKNP